MASRKMPATSIRGLRLVFLGSRRKNAAEVIARMPSGMFIQNAQRQPMLSVNQPPSSGPATEEMAKTPPMMPMYLPRCRAGTTSAMMACARISRPPPPRPWTARPAISQVMLCARPPMTEPTMKMAMAMMNRPLRPMRSPSFP